MTHDQKSEISSGKWVHEIPDWVRKDGAKGWCRRKEENKKVVEFVIHKDPMRDDEFQAWLMAVRGPLALERVGVWWSEPFSPDVKPPTK